MTEYFIEQYIIVWLPYNNLRCKVHLHAFLPFYKGKQLLQVPVHLTGQPIFLYGVYSYRNKFAPRGEIL